MASHVQDGALSATEIRQQVDRVLQSPEFSGSEVLRNLLSFLTRRSIERPDEAVKEYELGVGVLGKSEGFDPRLDSAVRVHTARLRAKLAEYYMSHGAEDPILIEVPKGSYHITWRYRSADLVPHAAVPKPAAVLEPARVDSRKWFVAGFCVADRDSPGDRGDLGMDAAGESLGPGGGVLAALSAIASASHHRVFQPPVRRF